MLLLAVWQVPQWLDWTRYRATIEVLASATLGQPVTISGPIALTLLPQPVLTASQVNVGGTGAADVSIHVEALRLRVALWPLLGGHVDARELVLRGPNLRIPWPAERGMLRPSPPAWLAAFAARIENGRLTVGRLAFTGIDGTLATQDTGALLAVRHRAVQRPGLAFHRASHRGGRRWCGGPERDARRAGEGQRAGRQLQRTVGAGRHPGRHDRRPRSEPRGPAAGASGAVPRGWAADGRQWPGDGRRSGAGDRRLARQRVGDAACRAHPAPRRQPRGQPAGPRRLAAGAAADPDNDRRDRCADRTCRLG